MFAMGWDADYEGLQATTDVLDSYPNAVPTDRDIEANELVNEYAEENAMMFDRDLGESSEEDQ